MDEDLRIKAMFHVSGIAGLTLLINGTFTGSVLKCLGMTKDSAAKTAVFRTAMDHLDERMNKDFQVTNPVAT